MANTIRTNDIVIEAGRLLKNKSIFLRNSVMGYDERFGKNGAKQGDTASIRLPARYTVQDGPVYQDQAHNETIAQIVINKRKNLGVKFTAEELKLSMDMFSKRVIAPAMNQLAAEVDSIIARDIYKQIGQSTGTPGTTPASVQVLLDTNAKMNNMGVPGSPRSLVLNPAGEAGVVGGMSTLFNGQDIIEKQMKTGMVGSNILGFDSISSSPNIPMHTNGSRTAGTTSAAVTTQGTTSIALTGLGASGTIKEGDVFTIADCYAVNPLTRQSTGQLYQFVAAADVTAGGGAGAATVTIRHALYSADAVSNDDVQLAIVNTLPGNSKTTTFVGTASVVYPQNLAFWKDAIAVAFVDVSLPGNGVTTATYSDPDTGLTIAYTQGDDIKNFESIKRFDVFFGSKLIRPEGAVRLWG